MTSTSDSNIDSLTYCQVLYLPKAVVLWLTHGGIWTIMFHRCVLSAVKSLQHVIATFSDWAYLSSLDSRSSYCHSWGWPHPGRRHSITPITNWIDTECGFAAMANRVHSHHAPIQGIGMLWDMGSNPETSDLVSTESANVHFRVPCLTF